jgi:hypothetical protein
MLLDMFANNMQHSIPYSNIRLDRMAALLLILSILLAGCGGGGNSGQPTTPPIPPPAPITFQLIYPGETSLTDSNRISVVGLADATRLMSVTIKIGSAEIPAIQDSAGHWRANDIPLVPGANQLSVALTENNGQVTELPVTTVHSAPILSNPMAALFDALNERVLVLDAKQVLSFDITNSELEILSANDVGLGPDIGFTRHFALDTDGAILVANLRGIQRVDPTTGDRSEYIVLPVDAGPISTIAVDRQLGRLFAVGFFGDLYGADLSLSPPIAATTIKPVPPFGFFGAVGPSDGAFVSTTDSIYTVSLSTIDVTKVDASTGASESILLEFGNFVAPTIGVDYDDVASRIVVLGISGAVFSLDPTTQSSSLLLPPLSMPSPPVSLRGLSIGSDRFWTVAPVPGELRSIDKATGGQTIEASSPAGDGVTPGPMLAGRYDDVAGRFVAVADSRVIAIDPSTGSRELLADLVDPTQPPMRSSLVLANGLALSEDGTRAWISDWINQRIIEVNLDTGEVTTVSGPNVGAGPLPDFISGIAINAGNSIAYVADRFTQRILSIDLVSGQRNEVTSLPAEFALSEIRSLVLDSADNRLILNIKPSTPTSNIEPSIYALDLVSLELTLLADLSTVEFPFGQTTAPGSLTVQMSLSADGKTLYTPVSGNVDVPYALVDLAAGVVEPLGSGASGVPFLVPNAIDVTAEASVFALDGSGALLIVDPKTGERSIISK